MKNLQYVLLKALEEKDPYTAGHGSRVCHIARLIALELHISGDDLFILSSAALLHDVGKIATPDTILLKPDSLSASEWETMKDHASAGARILRCSTIPMAEDIATVIEHSHEHFDGNGYPFGKSGHNIPLLARIVEVADCFDALTYHRVYHRARSKEDAIQLMESETKHDEELLNILKRIYLHI